MSLRPEGSFLSTPTPRSASGDVSAATSADGVATTAPMAALPAPSALAIALAGLVALAVAMGIGRFAFTPILPMMLHDGSVDLRGASWLASANYVGYLVGALLCTFERQLWRRTPRLAAIDGPRLVRAGLAATAALTFGMALPWPEAWPVLRFAAGVASAFVFVQSSGWCLAQLAVRGAPSLGGVMFAGPGAGIVASGLSASLMVAWQWRASAAWLVFALLAGLLTAWVWRVFRGDGTCRLDGADAAALARGAAAHSSEDARHAAPSDGGAASRVEARHGRAEVATLAAAYGTAGFGYIVTATFLPVIARQALPGSPLIDLFWPIFGAGVIAGALLSSRLRLQADLRLLLATAYVVQASGIAIGIVLPTQVGFGIGSLLLGLPFTTLTFFAMQEVRRVRPQRAAATMGLLTAVYGLGQIAGPPMVSALLHRRIDAASAFTDALVIAASTLVAGALMFVVSSRVWPQQVGPTI